MKDIHAPVQRPKEDTIRFRLGQWKINNHFLIGLAKVLTDEEKQDVLNHIRALEGELESG